MEVVAQEGADAHMLDRIVAWSDPNPGAIVPVGTPIRLGVSTDGLSGVPAPGLATTLVELVPDTTVAPTSTLTASATTLVPVSTVDASVPTSPA